jgi:hypothetical protein
MTDSTRKLECVSSLVWSITLQIYSELKMFQTNNVLLEGINIFCVKYIFSLSFQNPVNAGYNSVHNDLLEMLKRRSNVYTISHVCVAYETLAKRADIQKYALRSKNKTWHKVCLKKSKLAQHGYEEGHKICWKKAKVLQIEPNTTYRKYKESAHMSLIDHLNSQPSLDIF